MASTVPAKSNPLHNFDLPHLKWKKNHHSNNHHHHQRRRGSAKLSSGSSSPSRHDSPQRQSQSPMRDSVSAARHSPMRDSVAAARQSPMRDSVTAVRKSPKREFIAAARHSPLRESVAAARYSPMRDSVVAAVRHSPMRDSVVAAARHSPMRDPVLVAARKSPMRDSVLPRQNPMSCDSVAESNKDRSSVVDYWRHSRNSAPEGTKNGIYSSSSDPVACRSDKKNKALDIDAAEIKEGSRSKILLKIPGKNRAEENHEEQKGKGVDSQEEGKAVDAEEEAAEETVPKTWNLRPRKPIHKSLNMNGGPFRAVGSAIHESKDQSPQRNLNRADANESSDARKKEKRQRFSIALSREEIEEDIYAMTGSKAARRPKKRAKAVQKQLDTLFPGLWLASVTPDSYKVCENLPKG